MSGSLCFGNKATGGLTFQRRQEDERAFPSKVTRWVTLILDRTASSASPLSRVSSRFRRQQTRTSFIKTARASEASTWPIACANPTTDLEVGQCFGLNTARWSAG